MLFKTFWSSSTNGQSDKPKMGQSQAATFVMLTKPANHKPDFSWGATTCSSSRVFLALCSCPSHESGLYRFPELFIQIIPAGVAEKSNKAFFSSWRGMYLSFSPSLWTFLAEFREAVTVVLYVPRTYVACSFNDLTTNFETWYCFNCLS